MQDNLLNQIENILNNIKNTFSQPYNAKSIIIIKKYISELKTLVHKNISSFNKKLMASDKFNNLTTLSRQYYERLYMFDESETTLKLIRKRSIDKFISNNVTLADKEIEHLESLQFVPTSKICFIGSGPYPWSAIEYSYRLNVLVTCIDYRPEAIVLSKHLIDHFQLNDKVDVIQSDAMEIDYSPFSHVIIAAMVHPKKEILHKIYKSINKNVKIMIRSGIGPYRLFYEHVDVNILNEFGVFNKLRGNKYCELESYIITKQ